MGGKSVSRHTLTARRSCLQGFRPADSKKFISFILKLLVLLLDTDFTQVFEFSLSIRFSEKYQIPSTDYQLPGRFLQQIPIYFDLFSQIFIHTQVN